MKTVNVHEAKTHLSKLLDRVAAGEEVIIAKAGKPVARLSAVSGESQERVLGTDKGRFLVPEDFNAPLPPNILKQFYK
jgi:prevent-host-death family protein